MKLFLVVLSYLFVEIRIGAQKSLSAPLDLPVLLDWWFIKIPSHITTTWSLLFSLNFSANFLSSSINAGVHLASFELLSSSCGLLMSVSIYEHFIPVFAFTVLYLHYTRPFSIFFTCFYLIHKHGDQGKWGYAEWLYFMNLTYWSSCTILGDFHVIYRGTRVEWLSAEEWNVRRTRNRFEKLRNFWMQ